MTETLTRRMTATLPLAVVAVVGWIVLEVVTRLAFGVAGAVALGPIVGDAVAGGFAGSYFALLLAFPVAAILVSRFALASGQARTDWDYEWDARAVVLGVVVGLAGYGIALVVNEVDVALFGTNEAAAAAVADALTAAPWIAVVMLLGNGVAAAAAEERVWRGIVQTDLVDRWGVAAGVLATAILFSLKHALVDVSLGRLFFHVALGLAFGVVRHRWGTGASTAAHVASNVVATSWVIANVFG